MGGGCRVALPGLLPCWPSRWLGGAGTYHALIRVLQILQRVQTARPPAYLLENGPMQLSFDVGNSVEADFKLI